MVSGKGIIMTIKTDNLNLSDYKFIASTGSGNMFELEWFRSHPKRLYSVKDIEEYIYSVNPFLKESIDEDTRASLDKQIRRVMRKNFKLSKTKKSYKYLLDQSEVMYLVNNLMHDYLDTFVYPDVRKKMLIDATLKFYKFAYGNEWHDALMHDLKES